MATHSSSSNSLPPNRELGFATNYLHGSLQNILQDDPSWIARQMEHGRNVYLPFHKLRPLLSADRQCLSWIPQSKLDPQLVASSLSVLLGLAPSPFGGQSEVAHFAIDVTAAEKSAAIVEAMQGGAVWEEARAAVAVLASQQSGTVAQGRSFLDWNMRHRFCSNCGSPTEPKEGARHRKCTNSECSSTHFPRVDPVVISMIQSFDGQHCLLGRKREWLKGVWSVLAGFMEPGETMEDAVRREVFEESGIRVGEVSYFKSQPWPFPSSLMLGCIGRALPSSTTIKVDTHELEDVRWFSKDNVREMLLYVLSQRQHVQQPQQPQQHTKQEEGTAKEVRLRVPGPDAIAHHLIREFVDPTVHHV